MDGHRGLPQAEGEQPVLDGAEPRDIGTLLEIRHRPPAGFDGADRRAGSPPIAKSACAVSEHPAWC